ncbi:MAG: sensor domain-containing diguanylate cyclase [Acidimicrobiales bacterium]|nr:sensor domain-containing diguanylate cyclase [Acidimicrobiales bacterium]
MEDSWPRRSSAPEVDLTLTGVVETAVDRVLSLLARRLGLGLWLVTRTGGETIAVRMIDRTQHGEVGDEVLGWAESFCAAALSDAVPAVAPDVSAAPELAAAATASEFVVGSFVGTPLRVPSGEVLGVLCGIDPEPSDPSLVDELETVEVLGGLVGSLLALQEASDQAQIQVLEAVEQRQRDGMTGVLNRAGWDEAIQREAMRCRTLDQAASVLVIDLDDLKETNDRLGHAYGDEQIRSLARCISTTARADDVVARLGGDEFALLAPGSAPGTGEGLAARLRASVDQAGLAASIGAAECPPGGDLHEAWRRADLEMYASKRLHRTEAQHADPSPPRPPGGLGDEIDAVVDAACTLATAPLRVISRVTRRHDHRR